MILLTWILKKCMALKNYIVNKFNRTRVHNTSIKVSADTPDYLQTIENSNDEKGSDSPQTTTTSRLAIFRSVFLCVAGIVSILMATDYANHDVASILIVGGLALIAFAIPNTSKKEKA